jgi:3-ketosteroid 9alpha-monooxygenase subunit B
MLLNNDAAFRRIGRSACGNSNMDLPDPTPPHPGNEQVPDELLVRWGGKTHRLKYCAGDTLLETMRRAGLPTSFVCEHGVCGTCMVRRLQGEVVLRENYVLSDSDLAQGYTLACQGVPCSAVCEIEID